MEEVPGVDEGQGRVEDGEDVIVEEVDYHDPDETSSLEGSVKLSKRWTKIIQPMLRKD